MSAENQVLSLPETVFLGDSATCDPVRNFSRNRETGPDLKSSLINSRSLRKRCLALPQSGSSEQSSEANGNYVRFYVNRE